ncbi:MAG: ABC transporter ATP-binding protein [Oscillospiraceae bacterium]|nr:ABC transporter ATP-binding protein [Oscillospiraceae bacterium]
MIEIKNLTKYYGDKLALRNVSFEVREKELLGLLGPNGAGKSTLMNILTGFLASTSGSVSINDHDILEEPKQAKRLIGYLPENPPLYPDMTVREYLKFICELKGVPRTNHPKQIAEVLSQVKIYDVANRVIRNLSKGYKQRVGLAQALIGKPEILILDEPTIGLDPKQIIEIRNLIRTLKKDHTIILSSHVLAEIQSVCDRVVIIYDGKPVAIDTPLALSNKMSGSSRLSLTIGSVSELIVDVLRGIDGISRISKLREENGILQFDIFADPGVDIRRDIFEAMAGNDWPILEMRMNELTLEDIYLSVTAGAEQKGG